MLMGSPVQAGSGEIVSFKIKADANAAIGVVKLSYSGMKITPSSGSAIVPSNFTSDVNIYDIYNVAVATADASMGSVSGGNAEAMSGTPMTVTATPVTGYEIVYRLLLENNNRYNSFMISEKLK